MLITHIANYRAVGQVGEMHGREGHESMHDIAVGCADIDDSRTMYQHHTDFLCARHRVLVLPRNLLGPQSKVTRTNLHHLVANGSDMVNEPQLLSTQEMKRRHWLDVQAGKREQSSLLPLVDGRCNLRGPQQVRLVRGTCTIIGDLNVIVRAADFMLCAVAAG